MSPIKLAVVLVAVPMLATPAFGAEIAAIASFSILGDMVARVGGDRVAVTTIVGPDADTHVYEPKPADVAALSQSDIFFVSGLGFEGWMERAVEAVGYKNPVIVASTGVSARTMDEDGETITDPHAWQSLVNGQLYVANIRDGLCAADAAGCAQYTVNAQAYIAEIAALDADVRLQIGAIDPAHRKIITTHDAFGYFGAEYGVTFLAPEGVSTESEASAAGMAALIEQVRREGVTALFVETMSDPRLVQQIASETGAKVGGALYADALSGPDGEAPTYLDMFRHNLGLMVPAMAAK
jgi:zinc/manganese transport system substrate-binding protein